MLSLKGLIINPGLKMGKAVIIEAKVHNIDSRAISPKAISAEILALEKAISKVESEILNFLSHSTLAPKDKEIIETHLVILKDPDIIEQLTHKISNELHSAAHAVHRTFIDISERFAKMQNQLFAQRAVDYNDVANRLMNKLVSSEHESSLNIPEDAIPIIKEVTPSKITAFAKHGIDGFCSETGSYNSHSSILCRAFNICSLAGISELSTHVKNGDFVILDALSGLLIINPDAQTLATYEEIMQKYLRDKDELQKQKDLPSITKDNRRIELLANMELPHEASLIAATDMAGIGLFRTEFIYLSRHSLPAEDEQLAIYKEVLLHLAPRPVTFRSFDLGGDKLSHLLHFSKEENPNLGCRGIRFSLAHKDIFKTQLRAILRASAFGKAMIMFPMVIDATDFRKAKEVTYECMAELRSENIDFDANIPLGVMIEIPSAALCADELASEADFFSIGTNDLVQYTMAVDRNNDTVAPYFVAHHPAVLQLIALTIKSAEKYQIPVSVCGEMASQEEYIPLLIGMGITKLSIVPGALLRAKSIVRRCDAELYNIIQDSASLSTLAKVEDIVFQKLKIYTDQGDHYAKV